MTDLGSKIREILKNPPTKKVKCRCGGSSVYLYTESDGPNASDYGRAVYGTCDRCDRNNMIVVEDTDKTLELITELKVSQK